MKFGGKKPNRDKCLRKIKIGKLITLAKKKNSKKRVHTNGEEKEVALFSMKIKKFSKNSSNKISNIY